MREASYDDLISNRCFIHDHRGQSVMSCVSSEQTDEELNPEGVLLGILRGGAPPGSSNPDPISDQNMPFSTPVFRPDLCQELVQ